METQIPTHAESEFDDLLDRLTNELAMTPVRQSYEALILEPDPVPEPRPRADSARELATTPRTPRRVDPSIKIVAILTGSLTLVAVVALAVFGGTESAAVAAPSVAEVQDASADEEVAAAALAYHHAADLAEAEARAAARLAEREHAARHEAERLRAVLAANEAESLARKKNQRKRRRRAQARPTTQLGADFDEL